MKHLIKLILSTLLLVVMIAGCDTEDLHDMNINPNAVQVIDMNYFFTAAQLGLASNGSSGDNRYTDWRTNINFASLAIQHTASSGANAGEKYFDNDMEPLNAPFQFYYRDALRRTTEILKQTSEGGSMEGRLVNTRQAARIVAVFDYHRLTDWYGSVPYTEANKGLEGIFQPKYDKQKLIYTDLLKELDEACVAFNGSDVDYAGFKKADLIFGGDIAKWKKFGYSLMLRLAMRVSNVDAAMAATYVTKAVAGGTMASNDDNAWIKMSLTPSESTNQNGISRALYPGDGGDWANRLLSKKLVDQLKGTNAASAADDDPRLTIFTQGPIKWTASDLGVVLEADPTKWIGQPTGYDGSMLNTEYGGGSPVTPYEKFPAINTKMLQDDEPYMLMFAAESELLKAEAVVRGIGTVGGTAQSHYDAGVKLAMQMYTPYDASLVVSDAAVTTYLTNYPFAAGTALEQIGTQMWLSKFMMWWEAWSDWRRTGFPVLTATNYPGNATGGTIPVKLVIPAAEAAGNPNYAATSTQPDKMTTKVWWDGGAE
ncbi:MAG: SusD/RagB family nutrient-binding outer membrane lipoprotein [Bacteroidetes bacterium]|nr:SusD/RagB family nutrient-binding outer membrane lipoprotein [Bacteroidota bacterium]